VGTRCANHVTSLCPQKLALTSPTGGGRSVGMVRSRTKATEFSFMWENMAEKTTDDTTIRRMRFTCRIPKATNTHSEYAVLDCFSTTQMVTRTLLSVALCVHCASCWKFSIPMCYNIPISTMRQSVTQHLFYIHWYICQGPDIYISV